MRLKCMKYHASDGARGHHQGLDDIKPAAVFGERNGALRREAIVRTCTAGVTWTDEGVITVHTALQAKAEELLSGIPGVRTPRPRRCRRHRRPRPGRSSAQASGWPTSTLP